MKKKFRKKNALFEVNNTEEWKEHWKGMPEFIQNDLSPYKYIKINFKSLEAMKAFSELIGQTITMNTRSIWFPKAKIGKIVDKKYIYDPKS
jgi:hypothetical protein